MAGVQANRFVLQVRRAAAARALRVYNPMPHAAARRWEVELAIGLREAGYGVAGLRICGQALRGLTMLLDRRQASSAALTSAQQPETPHDCPHHAPSAPTTLAVSCARPACWKRATPSSTRRRSTPSNWRAVEDRAITEIVKFQQDVGLQSITDGEIPPHLFPHRLSTSWAA